MLAAVAAALLILPSFGESSRADPVDGDASVTTDAGYARILIDLKDMVGAKVTESGSVLIVAFDKPVSVPIEKISRMAPTYVSAARLDPDGLAIRLALARKVKVHTIPAAERLYVDLLPSDWVGVPPGLPQAVIDELAKRARQAEQKLRSQKPAPAEPTIRVKVGVQPTFVRYVFDLPDAVNATSEQGAGTLTLKLDHPVKLDLADAQATLPASVAAIDSTAGEDGTRVTFHLNGSPSIRSFREERSLIVDVESIGTLRSSNARLPSKAAASGGSPEKAVATKASDGSDRRDRKSSNQGGPPASDLHGNVAPAESHLGASQMALLGLSPPEIATPADSPIAKTPEDNAARPEPAVPARPARGHDAPAHDGSAATPKANPESQTKSPPPAARKNEQAHTDPNAPVAVAIRDEAPNVRLDFRFAAPTPAAAFRRGKMLWLVFDSPAPIVTTALASAPSVRNVMVNRNDDGAAVVRIEFVRPKSMSFSAEGPDWVLLAGDGIADSAKQAALARNGIGEGRSSIAISFPGARHVHRIKDPSAGDTLLVVTALGPPRGLPKGHDFVELRALASMQGVVVQPLADDVSVDVVKDKITIARPGGLQLSSAALSNRDDANGAALQPDFFDAQTWGFDRHANYEERQFDLIAKAAAAPDYKRRPARLDLARFYLARGMFAEAKGVLDVVAQDERNGDGPTGSILRSVSEVMLGRPHEALKDLSAPDIGDAGVAQIWRAMAYAGQGQCDRADKMFKAAGTAIDALPVELQRRVKLEAMRCAIQVHDFGGASAILDDFETLGAPAASPLLQLLTGRLQEGLGKDGEALALYRTAAASADRPIAAQAALRELALRQKLGRIKRPELIASLEELTTMWRGDETEAEALKLLAHAYTEDKRYRDAFHVMRTALLAHPNSELTQQIHDEAAETFEKLFLAGAGDAMPPIEALGLFYDYRDLTPLGRRGDDMIRRLADRLVSVDLLDQAAELLQHQVDYRLQGAARAQVAGKLAMIYLMNRKPDLALAAIQKTRVSDLAGDVRDQRLLLEARAMSEIGRHELALEMIDGMKGAQAQRLRADILWASKAWRRAAEAVEYLYGARWKDARPLDTAERMDVLRMAIGYALADETLSLSRIRERYGAPMKASADRHAFEVVTAPIGPGTDEFRTVAATVTSLKMLDAFLEDMRKRYPESNPGASAASSKPTGPQNPAKADKTPTGSIAARAAR